MRFYLKNRFILWIKWVFSTHGLVFIVFTGLLISLTSNHIQDSIQKQRYLELLQFEIRMNHALIKTTTDQFNKGGIIHNPELLRDAVFQAGLNNGYLLTVEPFTMGRLYNFYTF